MEPLITGAAIWLVDKVAGKLFDAAVDHLLVKMGVRSSPSSVQPLLEPYMQQLKARLDEDRIAQLYGALSQLKDAQQTAVKNLKHGLLTNAFNTFHIVSYLPERGTTGKWRNAELRCIAFLGMATAYISLGDQSKVVAEKMVAAIQADSSTAEQWLGVQVVQSVLTYYSSLQDQNIVPSSLKPPLTQIAKIQQSASKPLPGTTLWTQRSIVRLSTHAYRIQATWLPGSQQIRACNPDEALLLDAGTGNIILCRNVDGGGRWPAVWWSPDLSLYVRATGVLQLFDAKTHRPVKTIASGAYHRDEYDNNIFWASDSTHVALSKSDRTVEIWNIATGKITTTYKGHIQANQGRFIKKDSLPLMWGPLGWSPDGTRIASFEHNAVKNINRGHVWDSITGKMIRILKYPMIECTNHDGWIVGEMSWSPDGKRIAYWIANHLQLNNIEVMNSSNSEGTLSRNFLSYIRCLSWSPNGAKIALVVSEKDATSGTMYILNPFTGDTLVTLVMSLKPMVRIRIKWSPDGTQIASYPLGDSSVGIWNADTGQHTYSYSGHSGHSDSVNVFIWSPDGTKIVSVGEKEVIMWQAV